MVVLAAMFTAMACGDSSNNSGAVCGNGKVEANEECDDSNTIDGDGCDASCKFSCVSTDSARDCDNECGASVCNDATHTCHPGTPVADNQPCDGGAKYCLAGVCTAAVCSDGVDPATQCGGAAPTCRAFACSADHRCMTVADTAADGMGCDAAHPANVCVAGACQPPGCGDGVREAGEQCDDGNKLSLDGCDSACQFEESQRVTALLQQFDVDAFCPTNAIGGALTPDGQQIIQGTWDAPVADGTLSIVFKFLGLQSLTGGDTPFTLGFVKARAGGRTVLPPGVENTCGNGVCEQSTILGDTESVFTCDLDCTYDGTKDLDWWYVRDPASVDASETPKEQLSGEIRSGVLTAGPGTVTVNLLFAFQPADVTLYDTTVVAAVDGAVTAPTLATAMAPPGHLASEHLLPSLTSVSGSTAGSLCSQVSSASFFRTPIPPLLQAFCTGPDNSTPAFATSNTLLDIFVVGCAVNGTPAINPVQPDGARDGATYHFDVDATTLTVTGCTKNGAPAVLDDCLANATYSSYFKFAADRVILKRD
jgi:cysteine-rich repeat protein